MWGQSDLAGNVNEPVLDAYFELALSAEPFRSHHGGVYEKPTENSRSFFGLWQWHQATGGARCARSER